MKKIYGHSSGKIILLLATIAIAVSLYSCGRYKARQTELHEKARQQLQAEITNLIIQYQKGETHTIDLSRISSISWDRLYVFGPYIPLEIIQEIVGSPWMPDITYAPPRPFDYLVFTLDGQVVQYVEYPIDDFVNFSGAEGREEGYRIDEALFVINKYGTVLWLYE